MKGKLKLKSMRNKITKNAQNNSEISPNRSALREIILSIRKRDVSVSDKDDSDIPDTPYSIPDSGFSEFDFGEENDTNETPTSELLRKCRIARMESTLAKVKSLQKL